MRRGFTLIELLVVVAIIAILAAILFPVLERAREKAKQSSCLSNLKQLALAVQSYVQDYDEVMPSQWHAWIRVNPPHTFGYHLFMPYIKNAGIWKCPSDEVCDCAYETVYYNYRSQWQQSYTHNTNVFDNTLSLASIQRPAETPLLLDGRASNQVWGAPRWSSVMSSICAIRHNDGANLNYVDGHAKWLPRNILLASNFYMGYW